MIMGERVYKGVGGWKEWKVRGWRGEYRGVVIRVGCVTCCFGGWPLFLLAEK